MSVNILTHHVDSPYSVSRHRSGTFLGQSPDEALTTLRDAIRRPGAVRTAASRSYDAIVGRFPSHKMRTGFAAESHVEFQAFLLADVLERVLYFNAQPVQVRYLHKGQIRTAYPDIAIETADGKLEVWECKADSRMRKEVIERHVSLHQALREIGIPYRIMQPISLGQEPRAANAEMIWRQADRLIPSDLQDAVLGCVRSGAETLGQIRDALNCSMASLLALVGQGKLAVNIHDAPLTSASFVRAPLPLATAGGF